MFLFFSSTQQFLHSLFFATTLRPSNIKQNTFRKHIEVKLEHKYIPFVHIVSGVAGGRKWGIILQALYRSDTILAIYNGLVTIHTGICTIAWS